MVRSVEAPGVVIVPPVSPGRTGEAMTVLAVIRGRRTSAMAMRWSWEDGKRVWHASAEVPSGPGRHLLSFEVVFSVPGIHRLDLRAVDDQRIGATVFIVVVGLALPRIAVSGQFVRDGQTSYRAVPISLVVVDASDPPEQQSEVRWLDSDADMRSREVSWVIDAPNGWVHLGGTALGELGAVNLFRAHLRLGHSRSDAADRAEIRVYPPHSNPGVDPPRRVIAGPIQAFRSRGSTTT